MQDELKKGLVIRVTGSEVWVDVGGRLVTSMLRGRFRLEGKTSQVVAGDRVSVAFASQPGAMAVIEEIQPRSSWIARYFGRDHSERVMVANIDTLFMVATLKSPPVHYDFIDRVLVSAERGNVPACVTLNKSDLLDPEHVAAFREIYESVGYPVIVTSALDGSGVGQIEQRLTGGVYAFVGESGVGKSSLLMRIDPGLDLKVRELGNKSGRGRHTTTYSQLYGIEGGFLADTPGVQSFGFPGADKLELPDCFPEFARFQDQCRFNPCTHSHEPDCGIKAALERGEVQATRHRSYLNILAEVEERKKRKQW